MSTNNNAWTQRLRDPVWQFIGVVATAVAIIISTIAVYDVYLRAQVEQGITVKLSQKFALVYWPEEYPSDIQVYFHGKEAHNVSSFYLTLENIGDTVVRPEDYIKPLTFSVRPPLEIANVRVSKVNPASVEISVTQVLTNSFELSKSLLNAKDSVSIQLILVNDLDWSAPQLDYTGRIAGIKDIVIVPFEETSSSSFTTGYFDFTFGELFRMTVFALLFISGTLFILGRRIPDFWTSRFIVVKIMLVTFMTAATVFWFTCLIPNLTKNPSSYWWARWSPPIIGGGLLIAVYVLYMALRLRLISLPRGRQR